MKLTDIFEGRRAALLDLDGVILDTETQYSVFWQQQFAEYYDGHREMADKIRGQTLVQIFGQYFSGGRTALRPVIQQKLDEYERNMKYPYIEGFEAFMSMLHEAGIRSAIVTSSNMPKMENVFRAHPELPGMFDAILTSEDFERSKPDPDCYLKAVQRLGFTPKDCVVFEDSFNGLRSGRAAGMKVVGLATTNPASSIAPLSDIVISNWRDLEQE